MKDKEYQEVLRKREQELKEELSLVQKLLGKSDDKDYTEPEQSDMFPVIVNDKSKSTLARVKNAIKDLLEHKVSLQIDDIRANLDRMNVDYSKSSIHNAVKALRDSNELISYKINNSNHFVYYMNPEGRDDSLENFPVKPEYRPKNIREEEIETFDFKE